MSIRIAINGYGRIGRNVLRALYEAKRDDIEIVAINDLASVETNVHLTRYDTTHGQFRESVSVQGEHLLVNGEAILVFAERDPIKLPWKTLNIDVVLECTGRFTSNELAAAHLNAGAQGNHLGAWEGASRCHHCLRH